MASVGHPVEKLNQKLDNLKISIQSKLADTTKVPATLPDQPHLSESTESLSSNGVLSTSDVSGDATSTVISKDDFVKSSILRTANEFISPHQMASYAGTQSPVMSMNGYPPYPFDGVQFYNPAMDYGFVNQSFCVPISSEMQFAPDGTNGYMYGPQAFQYPAHYPGQPYFQQVPPGGHYVPTHAGLLTGGMMLVDSPDPGPPTVVMPNGFNNFNNFAVPIPGFPPTMVPQHGPCDNGTMAVHLAPLGMRGAAPWIENSPKGWQRPCNPPVDVQAVVSHQHFAIPNPAQTYRPTSGMHPPGLRGTYPEDFPPLSSATTLLTTHADFGSMPSEKYSKSNGVALDSSKKTNRQQEKVNGSAGDKDAPSDTSNLHSKDTWASKARLSGPLSVPKHAGDLSGNTSKELGTCAQSIVEQYNRPDFVTKFDDAKHFIIKSYSEDNVHKSIKYSVWASTPNGNKKLDDAYQDALKRAGGKLHACPVFLFFSVNGSRQFCGVAEMVGPVDYGRTMEFWEQHKWSGSFPVKWHYIKDVPNSQFRRIILENNENKPVTNSRDTQEVFFQQGLEMLNIFKSYPVKATILDELRLYPNCQKANQDLRQQQWPPQIFQKVCDLVVKEKERAEVDGTRVGKIIAASVNICEGVPKESNGQERTDIKAVLGKGPEPLPQPATVRLEKENIKKVLKKEQSSIVPA